MASKSVVVVGGTRGLGREVAQFYADQGRDVVITGRDAVRRGGVRRGDRRLDARRRASTWRSRTRSPSGSRTSATSSTWSSRRSSATATR